RRRRPAITTTNRSVPKDRPTKTRCSRADACRGSAACRKSSARPGRRYSRARSPRRPRRDCRAPVAGKRIAGRYTPAFQIRAFAMLALKLTLVPSFLLIVSMSGKWWGPAIAGWLAGLPVVAGPILYLLVLQHGPSFGAQAATLSLAAILASEAFNFGYAWTCRVANWRVALAVALAAWFACANALALLPISSLAAATSSASATLATSAAPIASVSSGAFAWSASTVWALAAAALGVGFGNAFLPASHAVARGAPLTRLDLAGRMLAGIALTLSVTALSGRLGAGW